MFPVREHIAAAAPDLIGRDFSAIAPDRVRAANVP